MSAAPAYSEDKGGSAGPGEPEYGHDPASGGIFSSDYKRNHLLEAYRTDLLVMQYSSEQKTTDCSKGARMKQWSFSF
ncbi:hypothetical protein U0070_014249 [Myodes glareolus]|uniref:Uncharacterized protein n=1 Tax=Myodes glareolus TaxID=447135 RepID=A0AAW0H7R1_MYOGA